MDEMLEWCKSFVFVLKPNGKVRLCLDLARLNQAPIRPDHGGPTLNDIFPKLNNVNVSLLYVQAVVNKTLSWIRDHHTSQYLHVNLASTDTRDCHF